MKHFIDSDIDEIIKNTYDILPFYKGKKILLTGGNGFLGRYFVEVFRRYNEIIKNKKDAPRCADGCGIWDSVIRSKKEG